MKSTIRYILVIVGLLKAGTMHAGQRPNIILFLVDDMGWMDSEPYGSTFYETPAMSRLAREGMLFRDAYAHPRAEGDVFTPGTIRTLPTGLHHGGHRRWVVGSSGTV